MTSFFVTLNIPVNFAIFPQFLLERFHSMIEGIPQQTDSLIMGFRVPTPVQDLFTGNNSNPCGQNDSPFKQGLYALDSFCEWIQNNPLEGEERNRQLNLFQRVFDQINDSATAENLNEVYLDSKFPLDYLYSLFLQFSDPTILNALFIEMFYLIHKGGCFSKGTFDLIDYEEDIFTPRQRAVTILLKQELHKLMSNEKNSLQQGIIEFNRLVKKEHYSEIDVHQIILSSKIIERIIPFSNLNLKSKNGTALHLMMYTLDILHKRPQQEDLQDILSVAYDITEALLDNNIDVKIQDKNGKKAIELNIHRALKDWLNKYIEMGQETPLTNCLANYLEAVPLESRVADNLPTIKFSAAIQHEPKQNICAPIAHVEQTVRAISQLSLKRT